MKLIKIIQFLVIAILLLIVFQTNPQQVNAACNLPTCCELGRVCIPAGCDPRFPGCVCQDQCIFTYTGACNNYNSCTGSICAQIDDVAVTGCSTIPPRCGDGACGGNETCSSCPGDCGACPPTETCDVVNIVPGDYVCNIGSCGACQRRTGFRKSTPAGLWNCFPDVCTNDNTCPGCAVPSCTISLAPDPLNVTVGTNTNLTGTTTQANGTISQVNFTSASPGIATATSPGVGTFPASTSTIGGVSINTTTITAQAVMSGAPRCSDTATVNVTSPNAWFQAKDADISSGGNLISLIPPSCSGACTPWLVLNGLGGFPGVAVYNTTYDFAAGSSQGTASSKNWKVDSVYQGKIYDYAYFARQLPADTPLNEIATDTVNGGDFNSGGSPSQNGGYVWYHRTGDLTINGNANLVGSRKVVLLVEGGNLYINGRINLQSPGIGFFMAIVGKATDGTKGDILVDPSVSHPNEPELQGIFMADSEFKTGTTGTGDQQLHIKGSIVAWEGVSLERDLGANNDDTPAELLEYDPALLFTFPRELFKNRLVWKEVAP